MCKYIFDILFNLFTLFVALVFWSLFVLTYDTKAFSPNVAWKLKFWMFICLAYLLLVIVCFTWSCKNRFRGKKEKTAVAPSAPVSHICEKCKEIEKCD